VGGTARWAVAAGYVEPGASATDDKRPEFQRMIERTCDGESAFDVIVAIREELPNKRQASNNQSAAGSR